MLGALVKGPCGELPVVSILHEPPTLESERQLLVDWVASVIRAMRVAAGGPSAPVHLYCYNRYDQRVLLDALKRHLDSVADLTGFFDLFTQSPALSQPIISFLYDELRDRGNLGHVCLPLHDAARMLGFDWQDQEYPF